MVGGTHVFALVASWRKPWTTCRVRMRRCAPLEALDPYIDSQAHAWRLGVIHVDLERSARSLRGGRGHVVGLHNFGDTGTG